MENKRRSQSVRCKSRNKEENFEEGSRSRTEHYYHSREEAAQVKYLIQFYLLRENRIKNISAENNWTGNYFRTTEDTGATPDLVNIRVLGINVKKFVAKLYKNTK